MEKTERKKHGKVKKILLIFVALFLILCTAVFAVCIIPCKTHNIPVEVFNSDDDITVMEIDGGATAFVPENPFAGIIFYPGARVKAEAYAPLMRALAQKGIVAVSLDVPFNLAFFDVNAADGIKEQFPNVKKWYVGGHSLGADVAGMYLAKHTEEFDGLVLFAGFITNDLKNTDLSVLSVYGENDGVLTGDLYTGCLKYLPDDFYEYVIPGGNHAGFAYYGPQAGDNEATISKDEQIEATAKFLAEQIKSEN